MRILVVLGYWNPMGFVPEFCLIKILCPLGNWEIKDEKANGYVKLDGKSKKAMHLINLIKQCKELASTTPGAGKFLGRRVITTWELGEEELSGWSGRKGDDLYQLAKFYENGVVKFKRLLLELIQTSDQPLILAINWGTWWFLVLLFTSSFETPLALLLSILGSRVV